MPISKSLVADMLFREPDRSSKSDIHVVFNTVHGRFVRDAMRAAALPILSPREKPIVAFNDLPMHEWLAKAEEESV